MCGDGELETIELSPETLVNKALELRTYGNIGLAYTYNEPLIGYEYVRDCATLVRERGMVNVLVTNGTIEEAPWRALLPLIDAANIDLKGFTLEWYQRLGGDLETVKRSIALASEQCHVEVTVLLIPGENDSEEEVRSLAQWLASVDSEIPLHLSRFFPRYRMTDKPPTPVERVYRLADVAREYLPFVYTGNC
jgi:pyruvate formate lyase activating enzyme